ncbi:MAG TPA: dienelactone hydrolase family protein [Candidatus Limnocylindria bacterium]|nr:dienelactone hydrolase family protein [Candidatus Limnocylindria bacterium]
MCYDDDARPPLPPIRGAAADARELTLTASDGVTVAAYAARAAQPGGPGIVVLPDVRGLHPFFEELALRFAEAGVHAVAIDYFSRTAGTGRRPEGFDYEAHVEATRYPSLNADVAVAAAYLRSVEGGAATRIYTVGFCMGGRLSFMQAADGPDVDGAIGFYGWPVGSGKRDVPAPIEHVERFRAPVLALWGGADRGIGPEVVQAFEGALSAAGVQHESVTYPDAPHSFFDRHQADHAAASNDAWRRMLAFMGVSA